MFFDTLCASFYLIECASYHRYLEPYDFSDALTCTIDDANPEWISRL